MMLILFITPKNKHDTPILDTGEDSFQQHNEAMKQFRRAHPDLKAISARDILTADGHLLAPVQGVRLEANARN
jgi:hypothetical protein